MSIRCYSLKLCQSWSGFGHKKQNDWYRPGSVTTLLLELCELHSNPDQPLHCLHCTFTLLSVLSSSSFSSTWHLLSYLNCPRNSSQMQQLWFCSFAAFPEWVEHINSTEKDLGSDYTMSCVASGKPKPEIRWLKNGQLVVCSFYCSSVYLSNLDLAVKYSATPSANLLQPNTATVAQQWLAGGTVACTVRKKVVTGRVPTKRRLSSGLKMI